MTRKHFTLWYRLDQVNGYLIWYTNDVDGVVVDKDTGQIPIFKNTIQLRIYAENSGLQLEDGDIIIHDLDIVKSWLEKPTKKKVDCVYLLTAWNLFTDVAASVGDSTFDCDRQKTNKIYDKLFWGNNLPNHPATSPPSKGYEPVWTAGEIKILGEVLKYGLFMFRQSIQEANCGEC
ncbi:MAG: hypothetical protein SAK29_06645 [Scytonema sp. PMC 1069.18]|nr:hypothetical protein [Scytonema sp. PMC 1069.18]MEC4882079.1 hypothetical protein [Scytonema sp. PMC 1070.18]